ncbi:Rrf2 family transcriptional regulator [Clostridium oryzae]|uniref:Putative HTH-type transcriptional regulator YwnA n=1 Tax=Clostridium oryzae TaxID=1450648 RepID=A0A1V4IVC3_9CLOT|nr:Rrf2 family transcriptional regulator [Clostridium oryzae]OPJ64008.1 putative HTH-type transcriptional regulator YwnA [Clostridium oryzae]
MKISSRFTMAVHIMALISMGGVVVCTSEWIAKSVNTNAVVIRRIVSKLRAAGFIGTKAGTGGYYLTRELDQITLLDVYKAVAVVEEGELFNFHEDPNLKCQVGAQRVLMMDLVKLKHMHSRLI